MSKCMVNIRMDSDLKKNMEKKCSNMGLSMTAAFTIFAKKVVREGRIPFEIAEDLSAEKAYEIFLEGVNSFSDDFLSDGRAKEIPTEREPF